MMDTTQAEKLFRSMFPEDTMPDSFPATLTYMGVTFGYSYWAPSPIYVREMVLLTKGNTRYKIEVAGKTPQQLTYTVRKLFCKLADRKG